MDTYKKTITTRYYKEQSWLTKESQSTSGLDYWKQQLAGIPPLLELPTDRPRSSIPTSHVSSTFFTINSNLTQKLKILSQRFKTTLHTTLLTAFVALLSRYTNSEDIVVGSPTPKSKEIDSLASFFANTLVLRSNLEGNPSFLELLTRVQRVVVDASLHQDVSFEQLIEALQLEPSVSYHPLFQVMFVLHKSSTNKLELPGLSVQPWEIETTTPKLDLTLTIQETDSELHGYWEYNPDLFDTATIVRMSGHFQTMLTGIVAHPKQKVFELPLLTAAEQQQLLREWNNTHVKYPQSQCIHKLFEAQVEQTPNAVAVVFENQQLTYHELNIRANKIAHHLQTLGAGPEVLVGICVDRSLDMVVGLLGILKAGGAYVPLDPAYPTERLALMLEDAQVQVLLTQSHLTHKLPESTAHIVCLDADWEIISGKGEANVVSDVTGDNLAYVIYTSGSTGKPKGVQLTHKSATNFLNSMQQEPGLTESDILLAVTTISFDIAVLELYLPLLVGAKVVVVSREVAIDGKRLLEQLVSSGATVMQATPATWRLLLASGWESSLQIKILCGGEALTPELAEQLLERSTSLWNLYGPTETTVWSSVYKVEASQLHSRSKEAPASIGRPIANTEIYLLDSHLQPVPMGVRGELHIGGAGLARGYLNRPELTNEKFIPNPFSHDPQARLYKTGDQARYLPDGNIEYIGRIDHLVKLRGFRIELGEIEAVLAKHPNVQQSVVIVREDQPGDKRLVAYIIPNPESAPTPNTLRHFLKQQLPEYMVPAVFVMLEVLPLTPNGKVDRRALPAPDTSLSDCDVDIVAPCTITEELIASIWAEILGFKQVGIHSNFFELGGHSLLATQVIARVRETFSVDVSLRCLFESPTVAALSQFIEAACNSNSTPQVSEIRRVSAKENIPLSFSQARLWFIHQLEPESSAHNLPVAYRIQGELNIVALKQSLGEIVQRHEALRTTFKAVNGEPYQVIHDRQTLPLPVLDLQHLPETERETEAQKLVTELAGQPFDLASGPLWQVQLLRLSGEDHLLLVTIHHIVFDEWSENIFFQELAELYAAFSTGKPSSLLELPIQYADFAIWQRQWLQGEILESQLDYWKQQLANVPPVLELPTDRPRPPVMSYAGKKLYLDLPKSLTANLKDLSQREGVTLYMTLLAAFKTLLYRYSHQTDIVVGSPIAGRNRTETEDLIGFFVNTLVLRTDFSGNPSVRELLGRIREVALGAYEHQDLPFEKLVEELQPERSLSYNPIFQVMFVFQNTPVGQRELLGLTLNSQSVQSKATQFDLTLELEETASGLQGCLDYNTDLFDEATISRMAGHFQTLLEAMVANPEQQIKQLPLLTAAERHQILVEWNQTQVNYPHSQCVHQLFEVQVEKTPDAIAVVFEDQQLTYRELSDRANQLAHHLQALGVKPDTLVALCAERSLEMVVGVLGILKAGGAYVPLDPGYPPERLAFILEDTQASIILTQEKLVKNLPNHHSQVICLDSEWDVIADNSRENPLSAVTPEHLIYVIYTSGSTGKPKGVMIPHRGICNLMHWRQTTFGITEQDKVLQTISFSFDPSVWQIFWPLSFGAQLIMARPGGHQDSAYFVQMITQQQITVLGLVPSILRMLAEEPGIENCQGLKHVTTGGEALSIELMERFFARLNLENVLLNCYGPTEVSIDATYWTCHRGTHQLNAPIGRPIANVQIYILDEHLQPVPVGESGELHVGGAGLARGYLNRRELSDEKFIPNPFSSEPEARIYKTGDLARYLPDGNIEFLGRIDHQVKIRGFRVELGEIEAMLGQYPALQQVVVIVREDVPGNKQLVAYVVANPEHIPSQVELRSFLQDRLPEYMVPTAFVFLDAIPLNANGKLDRRALPVPDASCFSRSNDFVAPSTPTEKVLATIWEQVLGLKQIGVNDNFFALGGHSLLVAQVISRVREAFGVELSLRSLFEEPTVAGLATQMETLPGAEQETLSTIQPIPRDGDLPLSFAQTRLWFLNQLERESAAYNMPMALCLIGCLQVTALELAVQEIVRRHEVLRTTFKMVNGSPVEVIAPVTSDFPLSICEVGFSENQNRQWDEVQRLVTEESQRPFDLEKGPLVRVTLLRLNEESHVLLVTMHHIISDGWSQGVFVRELSSLYTALSSGTSSPLPELPIQYADFAHWQRQWLEGMGEDGCSPLQTQLAYWKQQLGGNLTLLDLPTDQPRPSIQTLRGAKQSLKLSKKLTQTLKAFSQKEGATLFMTMLAAFKTLLYRYAGQEDIIVGTPIAGRNRAEIENLMGLFLNTLVLRTDLSGNPSFRELLGRVREVALGAYAHPDIPFEKLVEELHPQRHLNRHPLFDVMFNFINTPQTAWEMPGLTLSPLELDESESKFSMTLYVEEHSDQLSLQLVYQQGLFSAARMTSLLHQFQHLLEQVVAAPDSAIGFYSLVTPESRSVLPDPTVVLPEPHYELVTTMFTSWANYSPQHPAVCQGERSWNYGALSTSAHSLAQVLLNHGIKRGEVVAVFGQRSFGLIASMVGVFLSGGVLLMIDPKLPSQRQQVMLQESKAKYILHIGQECPEQQKVWESRTVICVDPNIGIATRSQIHSSEAIDLPKLSGDDAAYIFFTSGTTGIPKGVLGCHKGMAHFLNWQRQTFAVSPKDRSAQLTGLSFDVVLRDIFLPLTSGATLYLPAEGDELEPTRILQWLEREQISLLHIVPSLAQSWLLNVPSGVSLGALRCLFFAGEPLKDTLVRRWREAFPQGGAIVNLYGPTETTLAKCYYQVPTDLFPGVQPVGSPLPETQALVLAENNQLCGIGEPGQIVIRTPFRSFGYINASLENNSRFTKNPFRNDEQDLVYYTGDRGRYRPDGCLEILGRLDRQVKIRGVRIELREIEMLLGEHPGLREVVVIAREDQPGDQRLVAYVVPQQEQVLTTDELRRFLKDKLPNYMMPSAFVMLQALPLTPNGKVDRQALPMPDQVRLEQEESFVAPRNPLEQTITQIWEDVLGIKPISIKDNFFDLGGHSLLAVRLFAEIEKKFGQTIPLATLFQAGTIETLARRIEQQQASNHDKQEQSITPWLSLVAIQPKGSRPPLFCIHPLGGSILGYHKMSVYLGLDQPVYGLQPQGLDGKHPPYTRVEDMAAHYIRDIQTVQPHGPYFLAGYSFGGTIALEMAQQLIRQGEKIGIIAMLDSLRPGYETREPFRKRILLHLEQVLEQGPTYLKRKLVGWKQWGTYNLKHRYKHYLQTEHNISETDKHLEVIVANSMAAEAYNYQVYPGHITLLRTEDKNRDEAIGLQYDPLFGWGDIAGGGVDVHYVPGAHIYLLEEPYVKTLAETLKVCLDKAQALATPSPNVERSLVGSNMT
jgi:amino acid adenylation domain-containing protein